jgi:hypothetical protein
MELLFSAPNNAQYKDTLMSEFYPGIQANMAWQSIGPYVGPATSEFLLPYTGQAFHDFLVTQSEAAEPAEEVAWAINLLRRSLAYYVAFEMMPDSLANISDLGMQSMSDQAGTSNGPSQWVYKQKRWNALQKADTYLDIFLRYVDERVKLEDSNFETYANDPAVTYKKSVTFRHVEEMDRYLNIQGSRRAYNRIIPHFEDAEQRKLLPVLGADYFAEVKATFDLSEGARTQVQKDLVRHCQSLVAHAGLASALPHLSCVLSGDGIHIVSRMDGFDMKNGSGLSNSQAAISRLRQDTELKTSQAVHDLRAFLTANKEEEDFATWKAYRETQTAEAETDTIIDDGGSVFL